MNQFGNTLRQYEQYGIECSNTKSTTSISLEENHHSFRKIEISPVRVVIFRYLRSQIWVFHLISMRALFIFLLRTKMGSFNCGLPNVPQLPKYSFWLSYFSALFPYWNSWMMHCQAWYLFSPTLYSYKLLKVSVDVRRIQTVYWHYNLTILIIPAKFAKFQKWFELWQTFSKELSKLSNYK